MPDTTDIEPGNPLGPWPDFHGDQFRSMTLPEISQKAHDSWLGLNRQALIYDWAARPRDSFVIAADPNPNTEPARTSIAVDTDPTRAFEAMTYRTTVLRCVPVAGGGLIVADWPSVARNRTEDILGILADYLGHLPKLTLWAHTEPGDVWTTLRCERLTRTVGWRYCVYGGPTRQAAYEASGLSWPELSADDALAILRRGHFVQQQSLDALTVPITPPRGPGWFQRRRLNRQLV